MTVTYPVYPQYEWTARWIEPIPPDKKDESFYSAPRHADAGEGNFWNSTGGNKMHRTDPSEEGIRKEILKWWSEYRATKNIAAETCEITVTRKPDEEWCLTWFQHFTFDIGQTDQEALDSFAAFLGRMGVELRWTSGEYHYEKPGGYCAMGAEDRWRWCGSGDDGSPDARTDPPCRCKHCKEQGVIRIGH